MAQVTRWWWVSAAPIQTSGTYIGRIDEPAVSVDKSIYELLSSVLPSPNLLYSSPLKRALSTAEALADRKSYAGPVATLDGLYEQDFGTWEGKRFEDVQKIIEKEQAISPADIADLTPENGESFAQLLTRVGLTIDTIDYQIAENADNKPIDVLCVSHVSVIRAAIAKALDISAEQCLKINLQPLSLTVLEHHQHFGWFVHSTGWTPWPMIRQ